jgi:hypothetical protein
MMLHMEKILYSILEALDEILIVLEPYICTLDARICLMKESSNYTSGDHLYGKKSHMSHPQSPRRKS